MRSKAQWWLVVFVPLLIAGVVAGSAIATFAPKVFGTDNASSTTTLNRAAPTESPTTAGPGASNEAGGGTDASPTASPEPTKRKAKKPAATPTGAPKATETLAAAEATSKPAATRTAARSAADALRAKVVALTNTQRAKAGCRPLRVSGKLTKAAQAHSADMAKRDYFSHTGKDGRSPFQRITAAGYAYSAAAENIAAGQRTALVVVKGWMDSPGHRANIMNCRYTQIGVGYATGGTYGTYWTQNFGRPA